jgi:hypothetical protein
MRASLVGFVLLAMALLPLAVRGQGADDPLGDSPIADLDLMLADDHEVPDKDEWEIGGIIAPGRDRDSNLVVQVILRPLQNGNMPGTYTLYWSENLALWMDRAGTTAVDRNQEFSSDAETTIWVELLPNPSLYGRPSITLEYNGPYRDENGDEREEYATDEVALLPIEISEVVSDQIAGSDANKLPTAYFKGEHNNPMLMATRSGQKAKLRVRLASDSHPKVYVGARKNGTLKVLGYASVTAAVVPLEIDVPANSHDIYELVAGYDANANSKLDDSEVVTTFKKTPLKDASGGTVTDPQNLLDRVIIVDEGQAGISKAEAISYGGYMGTAYAGELIDAFAKGATTTPNATVSSPVTVASTTRGLSHPVGAKWNASNQDATHRFTYVDGSPAANDAEASKALAEIVKRTIADKKVDMLGYAGPEEWPVTSYYDFNETKDLVKTESLFYNVLGPAFGRVDFIGRLRISYKKISATTIQVGGVEVIGSFDDVYDWQYGGDKFSFLFSAFDPREPAMVQAGHATLSKSPHANAGKIFFTRVEFSTGFADTWNGNY